MTLVLKWTSLSAQSPPCNVIYTNVNASWKDFRLRVNTSTLSATAATFCIPLNRYKSTAEMSSSFQKNNSSVSLSIIYWTKWPGQVLQVLLLSSATSRQTSKHRTYRTTVNTHWNSSVFLGFKKTAPNRSGFHDFFSLSDIFNLLYLFKAKWVFRPNWTLSFWFKVLFLS